MATAHASLRVFLRFCYSLFNNCAIPRRLACAVAIPGFHPRFNLVSAQVLLHRILSILDSGYVASGKGGSIDGAWMEAVVAAIATQHFRNSHLYEYHILR